MKFLESVRQAFDSLIANKFYSLVIIGVSTVGMIVVVISLMSGKILDEFVNNRFRNIGSNLLTITSRTGDSVKEEGITTRDIRLLRKNNIQIERISGVIESKARVGIQSFNVPVTLKGVSEDYDAFITSQLKGSFFNEKYVDDKLPVAVVQESFALKYFKSTQIIGEKIILFAGSENRITLVISGILLDKESNVLNSANSTFGSDVYVPISIVQDILGRDDVDYANVLVKNRYKAYEAGLGIVRSLEFMHGKGSVFQVSRNTKVINVSEQVIGFLDKMFVFISFTIYGLSCVISAVILYFSVVVRKREFCIRKLFGANVIQIGLQILIEAVIILGIGIVFGSFIGGFAASMIASVNGADTLVPTGSILLNGLIMLIAGVLSSFLATASAATMKGTVIFDPE